MKYIAVDLGASSGRVIVGDLAHHEVICRFETRKIIQDNSIFWDIHYIFSEICRGIGIAIDKYDEQIESIGIDCWGADYCLLDESNRLLELPYCYRDDRSRIGYAAVHEVLGERELYERTGIQIVSFNTIYQLKTDCIERPEILEKAKSLLFIPDYLNFLLCGTLANELTEASTSALLDPHNHKWNSEIMDLCGLPKRLFQQIVEPGTHLGYVSKDITGSDSLEIKVIAVGSHDTASAVTATPLANDNKGLFLSSGTWSLLGTEIKKALISNEAFDSNLTNEVSVQGEIRLLKNIMGLWLLQEYRKSLPKTEGELSWPQLIDKAKSAPSPETLLEPNDEIFFSPHSEENPMGLRIVQWYGERGLTPPGTIGEIVRAILEGLAGSYSDYSKRVEEITGLKLDTIYLLGGGSQNEYLCQLTADYANKKVIAGPAEATALGNLIIQSIACGTLENISEGRVLISEQENLKIYTPDDQLTLRRN